jgi:hypothetical protein
MGAGGREVMGTAELPSLHRRHSMKRAIGRMLVCCYLMVGPIVASAAPTDGEIDRLIRQLGSDRFVERDAASRALEAIGEPALKALRQAASSSDDVEVRRRADSRLFRAGLTLGQRVSNRHRLRPGDSQPEDAGMNEAEWLKCRTPRRMLDFILSRRVKFHGERLGHNQRKWWLFATACGRRIWHLLRDERSRRAIEMAERLADGLVTEAEWHRVSNEAGEAVEEYRHGPAELFRPARAAFNLVCFEEAFHCAFDGCHGVVDAVPRADQPKERSAQCHLLRDLYGPLPFRRVAIDPAWLTWHGAAVPRLTQAVYDERHLPEGTLDQSRLAVLADALEEAGCADAEILSHLRGPGPHVRGCWPLDALMGKG